MSDLSSYDLGNAYDDFDTTVEVADPGLNAEEVSSVVDTNIPAGAPGAGGSGFGLTNPAAPVSNLNPGRDSYGGFVGPGGFVYNSYSGTDIVAQIVLPNEEPLLLGELHTISYSIHRENTPVRFLGHTSPSAFVKGPRTIAGSLIFTVFNNYAFYRTKHMQNAIRHALYPVADMLPPFDVVLTFANESGVFSKMKIYGITIVDEGGAMSVDDLVTEQTYSYMARGIQPLTGFVINDSSPETADVAPERRGGV